MPVMETSRLKALRVKQIIFINVCVCSIIPFTCCLLLVFKPSPKDTYLATSFLYGVLLLFELWSFFYPKHLLFMYGPRFMREIAEYEREKVGKTHDRKGRISRLIIFTFLLGYQLFAFNRVRNDDPMQIRDMPQFWSILAIVVIIFTLIINVAILYRIHKIDQTEPGHFRWFILKSLALGAVLGLVSVVLMGMGLGIVLN